MAERVVRIAVHDVLVHVRDGDRASGPVEMIAVPAGRSPQCQEAPAVDIFRCDVVRTVGLRQKISPGIIDIMGGNSLREGKSEK